MATVGSVNEAISEGMKRAWAEGKFANRKHGLQRLSDADVAEIRFQCAMGIREQEIADAFAISISCVTKIKRFKRREKKSG